MVPANERLKARDVFRLHIDQGLVEQLEFAIRDRFAQIDLEFPASLHARIHVRLEKAIQAVTVRLGPI